MGVGDDTAAWIGDLFIGRCLGLIDWHAKAWRSTVEWSGWEGEWWTQETEYKKIGMNKAD